MVNIPPPADVSTPGPAPFWVDVPLGPDHAPGDDVAALDATLRAECDEQAQQVAATALCVLYQQDPTIVRQATGSVVLRYLGETGA